VDANDFGEKKIMSNIITEPPNSDDVNKILQHATGI
jgi:hypothetical protein